MVSESSGLEWKRLDLHFHTPGSEDDYAQLSSTPEEIARQAKAANLDGLAVTDHTGVWIDRLKTAAEAEGIVVFPGVEVTVAGGERNVHVLAIFDPSRGTSHVHDFLAQISITEDKRGKTETLAEGDVSQVINKIADNGGVALLAHCDSASGVTEEIRGQARLGIIQNQHLLGAEITKDETARFFIGDDPDYQRKLAVFKGSDCHSPDDIGRRASYFKLGAMSITALRQCLYDPDTRIRILDYPKVMYPTILKMEVTSGFFGGVTFSFHPGLNTLLGGKGVGKSLVIEYLRFALDQPSDVSDLARDHWSKLEKQLRPGGKVTVVCQMPSGSTLSISRLYDGVTNPIEVMDLSSSSLYEGSVNRLLPILAYSQNEVIDISRDSNIQLKLIDRLVDLDAERRRIGNVTEKLELNLTQYLEALDARGKVQELDKEAATMRGLIEELDKLLSHPMFREKQDWDRRNALVEGISATAGRVAGQVEATLDPGRLPKLPGLAEQDESDEELVRYAKGVSDALDKATVALGSVVSEFKSNLEAADTYKRRWLDKKAKWETEFERFLEEAGGEQEALSAKRSRLASRLDGLIRERLELVDKAGAFEARDEERRRMLDSLDNARKDLYDGRAAVYADLTDQSAGRLQLRLS